MVVVEIVKRGGHITGVTADGHTGYAQSGEDIVCAALSSVIQTALLGLIRVAGIHVIYRMDDARGYLEMALPDTLTDVERHDADMILETMCAGVVDLYETWSDFIELSIKDA